MIRVRSIGREGSRTQARRAAEAPGGPGRRTRGRPARGPNDDLTRCPAGGARSPARTGREVRQHPRSWRASCGGLATEPDHVLGPFDKGKTGGRVSLFDNYHEWDGAGSSFAGVDKRYHAGNDNT